MKKPKSSRALIIKNNKLLLMYRKKHNREYYVLIGGKIKPNESPEEALVREVKEEANLDIISFKKFTEFEDEQRYGFYYFIDKYIGKPCIIGEELDKISPINKYQLEWIELDNLKNINLVPIQIKNKIIDYFI